MDLSTGDDPSFRRWLRSFLAENWSNGDRPDGAAAAGFRQRAVAARLLYRSIPVEYGGSGQPPDSVRAQIIREEFGRAGAPGELPGVGVALLVPTLLQHGTPDQRSRFIAPTLAGEIRWCQGYSEPEAGSDLEALRTTAVPDGTGWVINGQKVWTSGASQANWMFLLARTEPGKPRRAGLSYLLLDMGQPGVEVRPLRQINGSAEFSEVFLTGARTPLDQIVGGRGNGWAVSRTTLAAERTTLAAPETSAALMASLIRLAQRTERDGVPAIQDPVIRARLAELQGWINAQKYASYRQAGARTAGGMIDLALLNKLMHADIAERVARLALEILGPAAILDPAASQRPGDERWLNQFFGSLGIAIAGGTSNIQRNIIAERGLGLPRDPVGAGQ